MSDTNPLPAAQLLALADAMDTAFTAWEDRYQHHGIDEPSHDPDGPDLWEQFTIAREAYRAARAASPVTLEEFLIVQEEDAQWCRTTVEWIEAVEMTHKHALVLIDAREHARRLAGEGGRQ